MYRTIESVIIEDTEYPMIESEVLHRELLSLSSAGLFREDVAVDMSDIVEDIHASIGSQGVLPDFKGLHDILKANSVLYTHIQTQALHRTYYTYVGNVKVIPIVLRAKDYVGDTEGVNIYLRFNSKYAEPEFLTFIQPSKFDRLLLITESDRKINDISTALHEGSLNPHIKLKEYIVTQQDLTILSHALTIENDKDMRNGLLLGTKGTDIEF
jgi:hypothetical protein